MEKDETLASCLSAWMPELRKHWDGEIIRCPRCGSTAMKVLSWNTDEEEISISFRCDVCGTVVFYT